MVFFKLKYKKTKSFTYKKWLYKVFICLCWGFKAQSTNGVMSSEVSLPNDTFTGQA